MKRFCEGKWHMHWQLPQLSTFKKKHEVTSFLGKYSVLYCSKAKKQQDVSFTHN